MTLTELRYIVTLAQEQHFGRAAERCHVSQPTLSVGVKKLEDELGVLIFERSKSAVRLTPVGEGIVDYRRIRDTMRQAGFDGCMSFEPEGGFDSDWERSLRVLTTIVNEVR